MDFITFLKLYKAMDKETRIRFRELLEKLEEPPVFQEKDSENA